MCTDVTRDELVKALVRQGKSVQLAHEMVDLYARAGESACAQRWPDEFSVMSRFDSAFDVFWSARIVG